MKNPLVLIVDNNESLCEILEKVLFSRGIHSNKVNNALDAIKEIHEKSYYVVILDIVMPGISGFDVLNEIQKYCPETKVIIMTGYADKELAIKAIRMGAFDLLEKPFATDLFYHDVRRAIDTRKSELEHERILEELRSRNQKLLEMNDALTELMTAVERIRRTTEKRIIQQLRTLLIPLVEDLQEDKNLARYEPQFARLSAYIEDIESGLVTAFQTNFPLSPKELRVAFMVKNAMKNQEIARRLDISLETVKTYRRNIRKKLGITGTKNSLYAYLDALQSNNHDLKSGI